MEEIHEGRIHRWPLMRTTDHFTPLLDARSILLRWESCGSPGPSRRCPLWQLLSTVYIKAVFGVERPVQQCLLDAGARSNAVQ